MSITYYTKLTIIHSAKDTALNLMHVVCTAHLVQLFIMHRPCYLLVNQRCSCEAKYVTRLLVVLQIGQAGGTRIAGQPRRKTFGNVLIILAPRCSERARQPFAKLRAGGEHSVGATRRVDSVNLPPENLATMAPSTLAIAPLHLQEHTCKSTRAPC